MPPSAPALCSLRALRLLDPTLCGFELGPQRSEQEWLAEALLLRGGIDELRVARELAGQVLELDETPIEGLLRLADELIELRAGSPRWREEAQAHLVGQDIDMDLLVAAFLAAQGPPPPREQAVEALAWPSVLASNAFLIERVLSQELADSHVHLGGALPGSFYWIAMMVGFSELERTRDWSPSAHLWPNKLRRAQECRNHLATELVGCPRSVFFDTAAMEAWENPAPEEAFVDPILAWLLPSRSLRTAQNPALGERHLLWSCLSSILRRRANREDEKKLLEYLQIRGSFLRQLTYSPGIRGLARFQAAFHLRHLLFDDPVRGDRRNPARQRRSRAKALRIERFRTRHSLRYQFSDPTDAPWARDRAATIEAFPAPSPWRPARVVELRVTPILSSLQARVIYAYLRGVEDFIRHDRDAPPVRVGLVFHLLRGSSGEEFRSVARWQIEGLISLLEELPELRPFVVGIDAAGEEVLTPPRDLAEAFRLVRATVDHQPASPGRAPISLGRTFHAGEDFRDLLTGLRYIDEACQLFGLDAGERIGHALALAIDPEDWYRSRSHCYPQQTDHVLDLLWALRHFQLRDPELGFAPDVVLQQHLRNRLETLLGKVVERAIDQAFLEGLTDLERFPTEGAVLAALGLTTKSQPQAVTVDSEYVLLATELRQRVRRRVEIREIVIEACPTSNLLVGRFGSYDRLPYQSFNRFHLSDPKPGDPQILFSINSDDPGMFQTTVANEYRLLGEAMVRAGHSRREVLHWLDEARRIGLASSFIPAWSPPTREELLHRIVALREPGCRGGGAEMDNEDREQRDGRFGGSEPP